MGNEGGAIVTEPIPDLVVIGSGVAGLTGALTAAGQGAHVVLLTAGELVAGSSARAQGGIAAAVGDDDSPDLHTADTLAVGAGLNDTAAVHVLAEEGRDRVRELLGSGMGFELGEHGIELGLEAGHSRRRILHAGGGATGWMVTSALARRVLAEPRIRVRAGMIVHELLVEDGRVDGVRTGAGEVRGHAVLLATGGYAALWGRTTNAPESRGAGVSLAWKAGAVLADLEFVQFHPTALAVEGRPAFLLSEALRGEGAWVVDAAGDPIANPLLPRDQLARAIARHLREAGAAFLSLRHLDAERVRREFPALAAGAAEYGFDLARDFLPIAPAAHYCMGGVRTDTDARTSVAGLYAAGEVACTGVQGANRLASNSLLECLVFGARGARAALTNATGHVAEWRTVHLPVTSTATAPFRTGGERDMEMVGVVGGRATSTAGGAALAMTDDLDKATLGALLDRDAGVERDGSRLAALVKRLSDSAVTSTGAGVELPTLVARAALLREESRGAHFRADAPDTDPLWRGRIHWQRDSGPRFEEVAE